MRLVITRPKHIGTHIKGICFVLVELKKEPPMETKHMNETHN